MCQHQWPNTEGMCQHQWPNTGGMCQHQWPNTGGMYVVVCGHNFILILVHLIYFLFPLKGTHESILEKQSTFDALAERAQTLLQSTTDNRVTSQLTQLSARYTTLMSASKDLLKRYEQHVLDHEQYAESFTEAATWLQNIRDKLSVCSDTSGDKYTIQSQLEKLQVNMIVFSRTQFIKITFWY